MSLLTEMIDDLVAAGAASEVIAIAVKAVQAAEAGRRTLRQERNRRYYQAHKKRLNSDAGLRRLKTSESSESRLNSDALARVEDNPPLLEGTGFSDKGVSQVSNETFETLVPDRSGTLARRKQNVELFQTVVAMWNDLAGSLRLVAVRDIPPARQAAILARSDDLVKTYDFPDSLAGWRKLMGLVRGSPFLRGERNGFRCDFDFVSRKSSFTKIMEGKYEAGQSARR